MLLLQTLTFAQSPAISVQKLLNDPKFKVATAFLEADHNRFVSELIELTEIPAPPFKEKVRALAYLEKLRKLGLSDVEMDAEGNVMGLRKGKGTAPMLAQIDERRCRRHHLHWQRRGWSRIDSKFIFVGA